LFYGCAEQIQQDSESIYSAERRYFCLTLRRLVAALRAVGVRLSGGVYSCLDDVVFWECQQDSPYLLLSLFLLWQWSSSVDAGSRAPGPPKLNKKRKRKGSSKPFTLRSKTRNMPNCRRS